MNNRLTDQEIADYGPEFIDVMRKVAAEQADPLHAEVASLKGQLGHVQGEVGQAFMTRMTAALNGLVPGWQQLNRDPGFIAWSQLPDVFSGVIRKQLMQGAWDSGDPQRVAACFSAYRPGSNSTYYPHLPSGTPRHDSNRNYYTPAQISKFYADVALGRWADREELRRRLDADIQRASTEGRVVDAAGRPVSFIQK